MGNTFELGYHEMEADSATFSVIAQEYGKDNQFIYWKDRKQDVDYLTFEVDAERIPKDAQHVYYYRQQYDSTLLVIPGADPQTYRLYKEGARGPYEYWHQDKNSFYVNGQAIAVDRKTFHRLNASLGLDTNYIYAIVYKDYKTEVIQKQKAPTGEARAISENYARIGNSILLSNWKNEFAIVHFKSIDSIRLLDERSLVVNEQLMHDGKLLPDVDVNTWQDLGRDHFKDKNSVYYDGQKIERADPATFQIVFEEYSKDSQHVFYKNKILEGAKPASFTYKYNKDIATDGTLFFKEGELVKPD